METREEILQLLAAHSAEPIDYVAVVMLLNTVAGGHYEERHSEEAIRTALLELLQAGLVSAYGRGELGALVLPEQAARGQAGCLFRLTGVAA